MQVPSVQLCLGSKWIQGDSSLDCLPSMCKFLGLIPSTAKTKSFLGNKNSRVPMIPESKPKSADERKPWANVPVLPGAMLTGPDVSFLSLGREVLRCKSRNYDVREDGLWIPEAGQSCLSRGQISQTKYN